MKVSLRHKTAPCFEFIGCCYLQRTTVLIDDETTDVALDLSQQMSSILVASSWGLEFEGLGFEC